MARPSTATNGPAVTLDVLSSPSAADVMAAELYEHADRVEAEGREQGTSRVLEARVRAIRRTAGQLDRVAQRADADLEDGGE